PDRHRHVSAVERARRAQAAAVRPGRHPRRGGDTPAHACRDGGERGARRAPEGGRAGGDDPSHRTLPGRCVRHAHPEVSQTMTTALTGLRTTALKELLHIRRDPTTLIFALLIPMLQLMLFGFAIDYDVRHIRTVVVDMDRTRESRAYVTALHNT